MLFTGVSIKKLISRNVHQFKRAITHVTISSDCKAHAVSVRAYGDAF